MSQAAVRRESAGRRHRAAHPGPSFGWGVLSLLLLASLPTVAAEEEIEVLLKLPTYGEAIFGEVEVGAEIYPSTDSVKRVEFYLDSRLVGVVETAPFEMTIDAGHQNVEHHFQVVVYDQQGEAARSGVWTPSIETDEEISVDLQQIFVTVSRGGQRVLELERDDFAVLDNGQRQNLVTFERGDVPFTAVILVDASSSMRGRRLKIALEGATSFVEGMKELDQAKLLLFSDRVIHETPFTTFASVLTVGLAGLEGDGGTALNDHLYLAMKRLEKRQGRRVVVILSDGLDVESVLSMEQVRWASSQLQPVIYWIRLSDGRENDPSAKIKSPWRQPENHDRELSLLQRTVAESGGRIDDIDRIEDVDKAFRWILEDLRNQYVLGYYPSSQSNRNPPWHDVVVRVRDALLEVRTRDGYLEPSRFQGN